jgi:hypothetical protein
MNALPQQHDSTLEELSEAYKQADLKPKPKEEDYFLLNDKHPIWRVLFPLGMFILGMIIYWVGDWS